MKALLLRPLESMEKPRAEISALLWKTMHLLSAMRNQGGDEALIVHMGRRIGPVEATILIGKARSNICEKCLIELGGLVLTDGTCQARLCLPRLRVTCHDNQCCIRHAHYPFLQHSVEWC